MSEPKALPAEDLAGLLAVMRDEAVPAAVEELTKRLDDECPEGEDADWWLLRRVLKNVEELQEALRTRVT